MKNLILEGFMGCGKSTIGNELSKRMNMVFIDTDAEIEEDAGKKITDIFRESGEQAFREMETAELKKLSETAVNCVISLGGGAPCKEVNRKFIKKTGCVVYLKASAGFLIKRLDGGTDGRPVLAGGNTADRVKELLGRREQAYSELADITVIVDDTELDTACDKIAEAVKNHENTCHERTES